MYTQIRLASGVLHYSLGSLVLRNGMVYGHGWAFLSEGSLKRLEIELSSSSGRIVVIAASCGHRSDDVAGLYPDIAQTRYSGFRFHARFPAESIQSACLLIESEEGEPCRIPLHVSLDDDMLHMSTRKFVFLMLMQKAWCLVRQGQFRHLWQTVAHYATRVPRRQNDLVPTLRKLFQSTATQAALMLIDHDIGGGANMYRERMLATLLGRGGSVLVLTFFLPTQQFVLEYRDARRTERFALAGLPDVVAVAGSGLVQEIFYNNAVSFHDPVHIPELLIYLKESTGIPFRLALHDYFCICPSYYLLNDKGRYCDLPPALECNRCLSSNKESFVQIAGVVDIANWRARWGRCLQAAEEIICFSEASRAILQRAYPELSQGRMVLRPHTLDYLPQSTPRINPKAPLHIGVLGKLTKAKGAAVVRGLAEEILRRGLHIPITVIGTVDAEYQIPSASETGRYTPDRLAHLIELSGANLFLFPSICPETFSYVVAELIALDVPVVCFDLGAPAERVRNYQLGHVIPYGGPSALLDELLSFHARLRGSIQIVPTGERI